jgi:hypothetical protein
MEMTTPAAGPGFIETGFGARRRPEEESVVVNTDLDRFQHPDPIRTEPRFSGRIPNGGVMLVNAAGRVFGPDPPNVRRPGSLNRPSTTGPARARSGSAYSHSFSRVDSDIGDFRTVGLGERA